MNKLLQIHPNDNCLVALTDLQPGKYAYGEGLDLEVKETIPAKHRIALTDLPKGTILTHYGVSVGRTMSDVPSGTRLTTENLKHVADPSEIRQIDYQWQQPKVTPFRDRTFMGYHRADGKVGTANYWLFVPLVFCENRNLRVIEETLNTTLGYKKENDYIRFAKELLGEAQEENRTTSSRVFENIDGIRFLYHDGGCGGTRQDSETLLRLLAGYVHHPNVAGATVLSLGCQHAQIDWFKQVQKELYPNSEKPVIYLEQQQVKSEEQLIKKAISSTLEQLKEANKVSRKPAPLSKLVVGLECGGSDGFSGISANPAVGHASDMITTLGGSTILSEFPELNGVEQNLIDRCVDLKVAEKFVALQNAYANRAVAAGSGFDMNPSPGNIKDGLITDAIKSAGAAKKGGYAPVADVLDYTEPVTRAGLNLLCTPGNDVESTTGMAGSGANIMLFTTGLGTPTGNPVTPVIKIATNTKLAESMPDIIDVNAGGVISGEKTIEQLGEEILEEVIQVACGKQTKAMQLDQNDFILWKRGVSL
ncbi:altronate hydrolase [Roseivirga pacifica]|uniref:Altronate hydrolase n=1 Tax=Roseivirga pacifica TaxID=1267423 RepID=A0A1I0Q1Q9_9BACT|nr:altronate dehydratase family protein [Roseivirga pacifica]RKQ43323.1 altronate hydrolase [Roseivirga pacifica]SEW20898.1 altronate hydrolase [Roseivirga pacifica]